MNGLMRCVLRRRSVHFTRNLVPFSALATRCDALRFASTLGGSTAGGGAVDGGASVAGMKTQAPNEQARPPPFARRSADAGDVEWTTHVEYDVSLLSYSPPPYALLLILKRIHAHCRTLSPYPNLFLSLSWKNRVKSGFLGGKLYRSLIPSNINSHDFS